MRRQLSVLRWLAITVLLLVSGCASLPANIERSESHALHGTETTRLGQIAQPMLKAHPGESGFRPLRSGVDALLARMVLAQAAERTLDVQYYIWHDDLTGRLFADALLRAADRGVRVRVLLDDVGARADDEILLTSRRAPQHRDPPVQSGRYAQLPQPRHAHRFFTREPAHAQQELHRGQSACHPGRTQYRRRILRGAKRGCLRRSRCADGGQGRQRRLRCVRSLLEFARFVPDLGAARPQRRPPQTWTRCASDLPNSSMRNATART